MAAEGDLFFSLFPAPVRKQQTLFNVAAEEPLYSEEAPIGIRLGRFAVQPSIDASWIRGDNLLQTSEAPFVDHAYMVRGRVTATLLETVHDLKLAYEARYRDFQDFTLEDKLTHLVDLRSELELTPSTKARVSNHFVHGSFEAQEFDPGGEVVASTNPFYRNNTDAVLALDFSERFGAEISANYNVVEFLDDLDGVLRLPYPGFRRYVSLRSLTADEPLGRVHPHRHSRTPRPPPGELGRRHVPRRPAR